MLGHEPEQGCRRHLAPLDDAERDQIGLQSGCLSLADPGELGDGPQVQLGSGLGQHGEYPPLEQPFHSCAISAGAAWKPGAA